MTTLKVTVDDENVEKLKKLLSEIPFIKSIEVKEANNLNKDFGSALDRIKKIQEQAKEKNLFQDIKDPVEWQREIRKEWDRE